MRKITVLIILITCLLVMGCDNTTNSMIHTGSSNIVTHVYITQYGGSYHASRSCFTIADSKLTYIKRTEAEGMGYSACLVCFY